MSHSTCRHAPPHAAIRPARPPRVMGGPTRPRACNAAAISRRTAPPHTATSTARAARRGHGRTRSQPRAAAPISRFRANPGRQRHVAACTRRAAPDRRVTRACTGSRSKVLWPCRLDAASTRAPFGIGSCREVMSGRDACCACRMHAGWAAAPALQATRAQRALTLLLSSWRKHSTRRASELSRNHRGTITEPTTHAS